MIKCTGLNCPMQVGKVDPATCKAADTCKWATKPLTNADRIRAMTDEELALYLVWTADPDTLTVDYRIYECHDRSVEVVLDWLKQEVADDER